MKHQIAILDFGSQYTHLIARRIRQLGVLAKIFMPDDDLSELGEIRGLILSGGPQTVGDEAAVKYNREIFALGVPILGFCYGHQLIAHHFGGEVKPGKTSEYSLANMSVINQSPLFAGLADEEKVWMSHTDSVVKAPTGFSILGKTDTCPVVAMADDEKKIYGLQFHPEVTHTEKGLKIIENFVLNICDCEQNWSMEQYWVELQENVKKQVGGNNVFLLVSGGVDSTVCFALLEKILGKERVFGLHIDNGFMRLGESQWVKEALARAGFDDLTVIDATDDFLAATKGVTDPEKKREIIGRTFLEVKDKVMAEQGMKADDWMLAQGTIYPDTIESGATKHADKIKTHHNRVQEVLDLMKMNKLVEPLAELYKDEVREIGEKLELPAELLERHPFPGPGLAIRTLCSSRVEKVDDENKLEEKIRAAIGSEYQASVLPVKSVGVQGDNRTYRHPVAFRGALDWSVLHDLSVETTNNFKEVNRAVYLVGPEDINLDDIKSSEGYLDKVRLDLLRQADSIVMEEIRAAGIYDDIWQFPVVLVPLGLAGGEAVILRPIESQEAMTVNFYQMKEAVLRGLTEKLLAVPGIDLVFYDITNKPPGTVEWE
ncbi:MAG: glutamine-hydrolyzing GMP synthase [Parcubacteria group bacterium]|nr:glutamine-hydrolyzing GMP synthase [Parcubacteria group bacterium]